jgi:hypothetical protein
MRHYGDPAMPEELEEAELDLNPFNARVIGFVNDAGELIEQTAEGGVNAFNLLINVGEEDDVEVGERVLVFGLGPEMTDPEEQTPLGHFEIVRGTGKVTSTQVRMAVVRSTRTTTVRYQKPQSIQSTLAGVAGEYGERGEVAPFKGVCLGDYVRFV